MKLSLFQYVILWHPTDKQIKDEGKSSVIVLEPQTELAATDMQVRMKAAMAIPLEYKNQLGQIEIGIRPF